MTATTTPAASPEPAEPSVPGTPVPPASGPPAAPPASGPAAPPARRRHTARWIALTVLVIAAGLTAVLATRPPATANKAYSPLVGKHAPSTAGLTVDGKTYAMPSHPGQYVVVNFFASWCEPCRQEGPELVKFDFEHQQSGNASMLSVVFNDPVADARSYQTTLGVTWPTLADAGGRIAVAYGVRSPGSTFIVAPNGKIVAFITVPVTAADLDAIIQQAEAPTS